MSRGDPPPKWSTKPGMPCPRHGNHTDHEDPFNPCTCNDPPAGPGTGNLADHPRRQGW